MNARPRAASVNPFKIIFSIPPSLLRVQLNQYFLAKRCHAPCFCGSKHHRASASIRPAAQRLFAMEPCSAASPSGTLARWHHSLSGNGIALSFCRFVFKLFSAARAAKARARGTDARGTKSANLDQMRLLYLPQSAQAAIAHRSWFQWLHALPFTAMPCPCRPMPSDALRCHPCHPMPRLSSAATAR